MGVFEVSGYHVAHLVPLQLVWQNCANVVIRAGFQFDYVFDWTILKYQQSQISGVPSRAMVCKTGVRLGIIFLKSACMLYANI
jgi:hypothetical protein